MKKLLTSLLTLLLIITSSLQVFANSTSQDRRAVWISTVYNSDYPSIKGDAQYQKDEFIKILDSLKSMGINMVVVQVRPKADALYKSEINPWSDIITGKQGVDPGYDPMEFMIEETHKRNMTFHAWLNPYRVTTSGTDVSVLSENNPARIHPEWLITYKNALYYNPDMQEVKNHIVSTVEEIVKNYNVDGIHFDDYFYPSDYPLPEGETKDGIIANARRENVNQMVAGVYNTIKTINPDVEFGISPMGIWKNSSSDPSGSATNGAEGYYSVFSDAKAWIQQGTIDYITPQIYWETGHSKADYETLVQWWANAVKDSNVNLYIGQGIYKNVVANQIEIQLSINKKYPEVKGSFFFSLKNLIENSQGCTDKIITFYNNETPQTFVTNYTILDEYGIPIIQN